MFWEIWFNMDEDISAINTSTRIEKIKVFFVNNKKKIIVVFSILILLVISHFAYDEIKKKNKIKIADQYNGSKINFLSGNKTNIENEMVDIIQAKDKTYSPLALYFLLDNNIIKSQDKINNLFDVLINEIILSVLLSPKFFLKISCSFFENILSDKKISIDPHINDLLTISLLECSTSSPITFLILS